MTQPVLVKIMNSENVTNCRMIHIAIPTRNGTEKYYDSMLTLAIFFFEKKIRINR